MKLFQLLSSSNMDEIDARHLEKIAGCIEPYYPGYIAIIDIAAFKIRNALVGHLTGDREIQGLENIIRD